MVDPIRAMRMFGLSEGRKFSSKVKYIYMKQLEEADFILINKIDILEEDQLQQLKEKLETEYPEKTIFSCSARNNIRLEGVFERLLEEEKSYGQAMEIDYQTYGEGEALLGWLNASIELKSNAEIDGNDILKSVAKGIQSELEANESEIAHLKMTLAPNGLSGDIAVLNLVRNDMIAEESQSLDDPLSSGELIVNLRAEADPEILKQALEDVIEISSELNLIHLDYFKPGFPIPVHRDA